MSSGDVIQLDAATKQLACKRYTEVFHHTFNKWTNELGPRNSMVFQFINMRTYKYGKIAESIPVRHFVDGVYTRNGDLLHAGLGMSRSTVKSALHDLEDMGLVKVTSAHNDDGQLANIYEINFKLLEQGPDSMSKLNVPKKAKGGQNLTGGRLNPNRGVGQNLTPYKETEGKRQIVRDRNIPPQAGGLEDSIRGAQQRNREKRTQKRNSLNHKITKAGLKALWSELLIEHYPDMPILFMTDKEWGRFKKQHDTMNLHGHKLPDILTWIVTEWRELMDGPMAWVRKYEPNPEVPTARIVVRFFRKFVEQYASTAQQSKQATLEDHRERRGKKNAGDEALKRELAEALEERDRAIRQRNVARASRQRTNAAVAVDDDLPEWRDEE